MANKSRQTANLVSNSGISTLSTRVDISSGPLLIGTASSTGTSDQDLQVTGGAYISGSVGIGTTNPAASTNLDIRSASASMLLKGTAGGSSITLDAAAPGTYSNQIYFSQNNNSKWALGGQYIGAAATTSFSLFNYDTYNNSFVVSNTDNIGIGITNPSNRLHVGSATTNSFVVTGIGSVGIGTSTPTYRLQVGAGSTLISERLLITSGANATLRINHSNTSDNSSDIRFARDGDDKWILGSSNIGTLGGFDDFGLLRVSGGNYEYPLTAKYTNGNIGISNPNPSTRFQVGDTTDTFAVTGIGSVGIGTTNPQANLTVRRVSNYTDNYKKIVDIEAFDNTNPNGSNVLSIFGGAESRGGAIGFNVQNIIGNESVSQPPQPNSGILTCSPNYGNRAMSLITWNNVSTVGKSPNGASFNIYGAHPAAANNKDLNHYLMLDGDGNIGIGTTLSGAEFAVNKQNAVLSVHHAPNPVGNDLAAGVIVRTQTTSCPSLSTTYDVFRFLNKGGSLSLQSSIQGWLMVGVAANSSGAYQSMYIYTVLSSGLGTGSANYTQAYSNTRGTNPISSIGFVNDGGSGGVKLQVTTGSNASISPCMVKVWFIGNGTNGFFNNQVIM